MHTCGSRTEKYPNGPIEWQTSPLYFPVWVTSQLGCLPIGYEMFPAKPFVVPNGTIGYRMDDDNFGL